MLIDTETLDVGRIVARSILRRAAEREHEVIPGAIKTALIIQGGGTRAITSCSAGAALDHIGLRNAFDSVYSVSSGALNAAYFLSGQAPLGVSVYLEDIRSRRFLSLLRWPRIMNLEFLFEDIVKGQKKHDLEVTQGHPTPLYIVTTDSQTGDAVWFSSHDSGVDFHLALKASCAVPVASRPVAVDGRMLIDGMLVEPIPFVTALERDYTDVLVLHTRDFGYRAKELHPVIKGLGRLDLSPAAYRRFRDEAKVFNRLTDRLERGSYVNRSGHGVRIACAFPRDVATMNRFERRPDRLLAAAYSSWRSVMTLFGRDDQAGQEIFVRALPGSG